MKKREYKSDDPEFIKYNHREFSKRYIFSSLEKLLDFLNQFDTTNCYFRGQSGLWNIVSSLFRHSGTPQYELAQAMSGAAMSLLKSNKYIYNAVQNNDNYALAIAQHYGCPTDLVDITTSLQVAAYFAASENSNHQDQPNGCIWVFSKSDIQRMQQIIPDITSFSDYIADALSKNNGSLLIKPNIPHLSRLNAQNGAFLWDVGGVLNQLIHICEVGVCFVFQHTPDEKKIFSKNEGELFPLPNQLESEIMRIFTEKSRENGLPIYIGPISAMLNEYIGASKNGIASDLRDLCENAVELPFPDLFTPSFGEYPWEQRTVTHSDIKPNNVNMEKFMECHLHFDLEGMQTFVEHVLTGLENENLTDYLVILYDIDQKAIYAIEDTRDMVSIVINLNNYLYSHDEIAQVLLEYLRMTVFKQQKQFTPQSHEEFVAALICKQIDDLVKEYYGCAVTKLNLYETGEHVSFWLPSDYPLLDSAYLEEFKKFDKSCFVPHEFLVEELEDLPDNAEIFLYQHKPQKIVSFDCMKRVFIQLVIPQLFAFRPVSERLYIPDYIKRISLPYFGRTMCFY